MRRRLLLVGDLAGRVELSREPAPSAGGLGFLGAAPDDGELLGWLGVSRPESVPNLTRRLRTWLTSDVRVRQHFRRIEEELDRLGWTEKT